MQACVPPAVQARVVLTVQVSNRTMIDHDHDDLSPSPTFSFSPFSCVFSLCPCGASFLNDDVFGRPTVMSMMTWTWTMSRYHCSHRNNDLVGSNAVLKRDGHYQQPRRRSFDFCFGFVSYDLNRGGPDVCCPWSIVLCLLLFFAAALCQTEDDDK